VCAITRGKPLVVETVEVRRHLREMVEHRPTTSFGRVGREDRHYAQAGEQRSHVVGADPVSGPLLDCRSNGLDYRGLPAIASAKHPHPMLLLGDVHQLQLLRQGMSNVGKLGRAECRHALREGLARRAAPLSTKLGRCGSKLVDDCERFRPRSLRDRVVEQTSQKLDVIE
jgi:hypothetical protein